MKKMKKLIGLLLVVALVGAAVGGTLAYLQDTDSDVNVMTLGNVYIEQHEYERVVNADGTYATNTIDNQTSYVLKDFTQAKPLLPIVGDPNEPGDSPAYAGYDSTIVRMTQVDSYGSMQVFAGKNAQDKFVTVQNTGKSDAYVRTLVAIECGTGDAGLIGIGNRCVPAEDAATSTSPWVSNEIGKILVDNNTYTLFEYVYRGASDVSRHVNGVLPAGDTTYPNLCQVYLKHKATNEDMESIDGNNNGTLDILVLSQAVQADGFAATTDKSAAEVALDAAFGDITTANHPWVASATTVEVDSADELTQALAAGNDVKLTADVAIDDTVTVVGTSTLDLNDKKLTINGEGREHAIDNYGTLTVKGGTIEVANTNGGSAIRNNGTLTVENATLDGAPFGGDSNVGWPSYVVNNYGEATISNTTVVGDHGGIYCGTGTKTTLNNVSVTIGVPPITSNGVYAYEGSDLTINGGSYSVNTNAHGSCSTVRVSKGATYTTDGNATFSEPVWNENN